MVQISLKRLKEIAESAHEVSDDEIMAMASELLFSRQKEDIVRCLGLVETELRRS